MDAEQQTAPQSVADHCTDFFLLGLQIRAGSVELPACETMRRRVLLLFETLKSKAQLAGVIPTDLDDVRYALAAYLDEMIQYAEWPGKGEWEYMGYSMRTRTHRYTEWRRPDGSVAERELYDHRADGAETVNFAGREPGLVEDLRRQLRAGWRAELSNRTSIARRSRPGDSRTGVWS